MSGGKADTPRSSEAADADDVRREDGGGESRATGIRSTGAPVASSEPGEAGNGDDAPNGTTRPDWIGRVIDDRYEIVEHLGEGGMGEVFVSEHRKLRKRVALKVILPQFAGDGEIAERFAREAMASAKLDHPHVAGALDYGTLPEGGAYLVMQLARGKSLDKVLRERGAQPWPWACMIGAQVADALAAAHAEGIVHRDLKPENILVERRDDGTDFVKVLDFGIARVQSEEIGESEGETPQRALTRLGTVMGTPGYMSPEQSVGERVDHRTDIYALGVIIWEMMAGRSLYEGNDLTQIMTRQLTEAPPSIREAAGNGSIPPSLDQLIQNMLARTAASRPQQAGEVRDWLRQLGQVAAPASGVTAAEAPSGSHAFGPGANAATAQTMMATGPAQAGSDHRTGYGLAQATAAPGPAGVQPMPARPTGAQPPGSALLQGIRSIPARTGTGPTIAGIRIPIPLIVTGCAVPLFAGGVALALVLALGGGSEASSADAEGAQDEGTRNKLAELLERANPVRPQVPPDVEEHIDRMLNSDKRSERRYAAKWLQEYEPQDRVPEYALAVAEWERARGCRDRKAALRKVVEAGDDRALPALERIDDKPRRGCGLLNLRDCYGCIRRPLADAIDRLEGGESPADGADEPKGQRP